MFYALWDLRLGNQLATFSTKEEALDAVYEWVSLAAGLPSDLLALECESETGDSEFVAEGQALVQLAREHHRVRA